MSAVAKGRSWMVRQRERMVSRRASASVAVRRRMTLLGGSSKVLRKALAALILAASNWRMMAIL